MIYLGIDPGANGGIATIGGNTIKTFKMPDNVEALADFFEIFSRDNTKILCEAQQARPTVIRSINPVTNTEEIRTGVGAGATWTFAQHYGEIIGVLTALRFKVTYMRPQDWMRFLGIPKREKGSTQTAWKNVLKDKAIYLFPGIKIIKATADALLIAEVCRRLDGIEKANPGFTWDDI